MAPNTELVRKLRVGRTTLWWCGLAAALIVLAVAVRSVWVGLPPRVVLMTSGAPGSDYEALAERYRDILKRSGVELRLLPSAGSVGNLQRLNDAKAGVAVCFAQGGVTNEVKSPDLTSLGTMFFEPLWFFTRVPIVGSLRESLRGRRVSIGEPGSGTRALSVQFLALNGLGANSADLRSLSTAQAAEALLHGDIDAAAMAASWESPTVHRLLESAEVDLVSFVRADAYVALSPFFSKLRLPAGVGNLETNRPPTDVNLVAPKTSLIVRRDLHPAIQYLLLEAAAEIHSAQNVFQPSGRFPAAERDDFPLSENAQQFYKTGPPFLQRYLPFWLAVFVSRLLLILIPAAAVAYPLLNAEPALRRWHLRRQVLPLYEELRLIEKDVERSRRGAKGDALARLQHWEERANQSRVPLEYVPVLYSLLTYGARLRERAASANFDATAAGREFRLPNEPQESI